MCLYAFSQLFVNNMQQWKNLSTPAVSTRFVYLFVIKVWVLLTTEFEFYTAETEICIRS